MPPFRLQTFGSLSLLDPSGAAIPGHGAQRRRLALLAVLAASGDRGRGRDSLLTLFWPDASPERARHSLEQLLYGIRTAAGSDALSGVNPVGLNREVIRSDVAEFGRALAEDRLEDAVAEYGGPFLDGFVLPDALEFEQWAEIERARLAAAYARALEALAVAAEGRSDVQRAVGWWEKRAAHDPYDSRVAQCYMRALEASGNTGRAIQHAATHERLLRQELGVRASTEVSALAEQMRGDPRAASSALHLEGTVSAPPASRPGSAVPAESAAGASAEPDPVRSPGSAAPIARSDARREARRHPWALALSLVGAALVGLLVWQFWPTARAPERSVAVLPFLDMSPRGDNEYFSDGITEEIISQLSTIPALKVISRTSAMHYKGSTKPLRAIAAELGVANVLEGSVRRDGDTIRITAQLIDAGADRHLWAQSYDRNAADAIGVQDEIAREVSRALEVQLGGPTGVAARRGTRDPEAYEYYRRGRYLWNKRTKDAHEQAIAYYRRAIERDSGYAAAYAGLSDAYLTAYQFNISTIPEPEVYSRIKWAAERALALDARSADAHTSFAVALWWQRDWPGAERELRRALELNPGYATARAWYALLLIGMGRLGEAVQQSRRASELDPFSVVVLDNTAWIRFLTHDVDGAIELYGKSLEINDAWAPGFSALGVIYAQKGMDDAAMRAASRAVELGGRQISSFQANLAYVHARAGRRGEATRLLERAKQDPWEGFDIARAYVALGEPDSAFAWLDRSSWTWPHRAVLADPALDPVRADPRFARLSARVAREMGIQESGASHR
jgi:TolB-like protein/DNA-binding SARP family transcriptional activator/Tfp pilus assembly protein PilF